MEEKRLKDQVAWVSGAASGMGAAIARRFASAGAKIMAVDVQQELGEEVVAQIHSAGGEAIFASCDVARGTEVATQSRLRLPLSVDCILSSTVPG